MRPAGAPLRAITFHRFQLSRHCPRPQADLWRTFVDREYLIDLQQRFAGSRLNPGFFFSLTPEACAYEMAYYHRASVNAPPVQAGVAEVLTALRDSRDERVFLSCEAWFDDVLDLFKPAVLWEAVRASFPNMRTPPPSVDAGSVLLQLADTATGGNLLTDVLGQYAYRQGFSGVLFPSARALETGRTRPWTAGTLRESLRHGLVGEDSFEFDDLLHEIRNKAANLVLFNGAYITHSVRRYRLLFADGQDSGWIINDLCGASLDVIRGRMAPLGGLDEEDIYSMCDGLILDRHFTFRGST